MIAKAYPAIRRVFNGVNYSLWTTVSYKKMASSIAKDLHEEGYLARIVKAPDGWSVYSRKK
jgi:hypothetical protein